MRVAMLSSEWGTAADGSMFPATTGYYRLLLPARELSGAGHEVVCGPGSWATVLPSGELAVRTPDGVVDGFELVVVNGWWADTAPGIVRRAQATGQRFVVDLDDDYWSMRPTNRFLRSIHPDSSPELNRDHLWRLLGTADAVTVSTPPLAARVGTLGRPVYVVRDAMDVSAPWPVQDVSDGPAYAWVGGTAFRDGDLETLRGVLGPFLERHRVRFIHGADQPGAPAFAAEAGVDPGLVETRPAVALPDYPSLFPGIDVGLVPLARTPYNRAKGCLKGMEYAVCGIPFIAQRTPAYEWLGAGILVDKPAHWRRALERMLDPGERARMGAECRARVEREDIGLRWPEWEAVYREVLAGA